MEDRSSREPGAPAGGDAQGPPSEDRGHERLRGVRPALQPAHAPANENAPEPSKDSSIAPDTEAVEARVAPASRAGGEQPPGRDPSLSERVTPASMAVAPPARPGPQPVPSAPLGPGAESAPPKPVRAAAPDPTLSERLLPRPPEVPPTPLPDAQRLLDENSPETPTHPDEETHAEALARAEAEEHQRAAARTLEAERRQALARAEALALAEEEARLQALARAEEEAHAEARARAQEEARLQELERAEEEAQAREEEERARALARAEEERLRALARAQEQARAEALAREAEARAGAAARAEEDARLAALARAEDEARAAALARAAEEEARAAARARAEEEERAQAQARAREEARLEALARAQEQARAEALARAEQERLRQAALAEVRALELEQAVPSAPARPFQPPPPRPPVVLRYRRPRRGVLGYVRLALQATLVLTLVLAAFVLLLVVLYRSIDPPASALMLSQRLAGTPILQRWTPLERISPQLVQAVIASEDARFCRHRGVDWGELEQAIDSTRDGLPRGGSTISMQLVKNLFLWPSKSYVRKAIEIPLAYLVEAAWSKRRVLEIYLNVAEWGPGVFGAEAAARYHFRKPASLLSAREAALLAVALPNPFERFAGNPGPGTLRLADNLLLRMRAAPSLTACVRPARLVAPSPAGLWSWPAIAAIRPPAAAPPMAGARPGDFEEA